MFRVRKKFQNVYDGLKNIMTHAHWGTYSHVQARTHTETTSDAPKKTTKTTKKAAKKEKLSFAFHREIKLKSNLVNEF